MAGATVEDLALMLEWAANAPGYEYQRDNGYLRWSSLLGKSGRSKLADRVEAAKEWKASGGHTTKAGSKDAWFKEWGSAFEEFISSYERGDRIGGRDSFMAWLPRYSRKALPVPDGVLDVIDRRTGAQA
jgi:hypothetical protein